MARIPHADGAATRQRILAEARTLFLKRGYRATPMSHVAKAAGVTTPALYWHFASKDDLYFEVVHGEYASMLKALIKVSEEGSAEERLAAYVKTFVILQLEEADFDVMYGFAQLKAALTPARRAEITALEREYPRPLQKILEDGIQDGSFHVTDHRVASRAIAVMCEYVFLWFREGGRYSSEEVGALYAEMAIAIARGVRSGDGAAIPAPVVQPLTAGSGEHPD